MALPTPVYNIKDFPDVYEPSEDSYLFLDALEKDQNFLRNFRPVLVCEVGCGSGILITALATILKNSCGYFATDINLDACASTKCNATLNGVQVESVGMNLTSALRCQFDVILFNPPYVVTDEKELIGNGLNRAYAGGKDGKEVIDEFLGRLPDILANNGVCYILLLKENKVEEIEESLRKQGFKSEVVVQRRIPGEYLYVYKLFR